MAMQEVELALKGMDAHERGAKMAQLECKPKHSTNNEYLLSRQDFKTCYTTKN